MLHRRLQGACDFSVRNCSRVIERIDRHSSVQHPPPLPSPPLCAFHTITSCHLCYGSFLCIVLVSVTCNCLS
jgi:hypothetical protein